MGCQIHQIKDGKVEIDIIINMPILQKNNYLTLDLGNKVFNFSSDTFKLAFTNTSPTTLTHYYSDIVSPLALTNLVGTNPVTLTSVSWTQNLGTSTFTAANLTITSQLGNFGAFRYIIIYDDSATNKNIVGWYDCNSEIILDGLNSNQLLMDFSFNIILST